MDPFLQPVEAFDAVNNAADDPFANEKWIEFPIRPPNSTNLRNNTTKGGYFLRPPKAGIQKGVRNVPTRGLRPGETRLNKHHFKRDIEFARTHFWV